MPSLSVVPDPVDRLFSGAPDIGPTHALLAVHRGQVVLERYGDGIGEGTTLRSWSMAKSMLHAAVGMLVAEGALVLDDPAPVPAWSDPADPRHAITLRHLMTMRSGLAWVEAPAEGQRSDVVDMFYGNGRRPFDDTAAWAAARPLAAEPGSRFLYSSGNSAIVSGIVRDLVGSGPDYERWLRDRLFDPLGMTSATPKFDPSGAWMASSFCYCTARDFARFGELYLADGLWDGTRLLSEDWVATARTETGRDDEGRIHTAHWWRFGDNPWGAHHCSGYLGQYVVVVPPLDLVVVRLGDSPPSDRGQVAEALRSLIVGFER